MPSPGQHRSHVHVLGGTISAGEYIGEDELFFPEVHGSRASHIEEIIIRPQRGKIDQMLRTDIPQNTKDLFANISCSEANELVDSADYDVKHLMRIVREVRALLATDLGHLILPSGTDTAAFLLHALADGIPSSLLGERNILVVVSQKHASIPGSPNRPESYEGQYYPSEIEAVASLHRALVVSLKEKMRGRIGLCCGDRVLPPRGLQKVNAVGDDPFYCRFRDQAFETKEEPRRWMFELPRPVDCPRGKEEDYTLIDGVEVVNLGPTSNLKNLPAMVWGALHPSFLRRIAFRPKQTQLRGLVVQVPGQSNLRQKRADLQQISVTAEISAKEGIPVVVISDPLQSQSHYAPSTESTARYAGNLAVVQPLLDRLVQGGSHLVDGGDLSRAEATILTSAAVAKAREHRQYKGPDIVRYVQDAFERYWEFLAKGESSSGPEDGGIL